MWRSAGSPESLRPLALLTATGAMSMVRDSLTGLKMWLLTWGESWYLCLHVVLFPCRWTELQWDCTYYFADVCLVFAPACHQRKCSFTFSLCAWQKAQCVRQSVLSTPFECHDLFWNKCVAV